MAQVLRPLRQTFSGDVYDHVLVGLETPDDAAVYRLRDDLALVVTLDFFTPIVDDPYAYGAIAAANSLSDVYAMGARPLLALNVAAMPSDLPPETIAEILRGGAEKARQAGVPVAGGHTIRDPEPKYGLVVVGACHPDEVRRKGGARPGDALLLSKPLGTGVVTTALMRDAATEAEVAAATESMMRLNADAAEIACAHGARAVTDVTGFGLLGHAAEMAEQGGVGLRFDLDRLPWLPGAERLAAGGYFPGGADDNRRHFGEQVELPSAVDNWRIRLCFSPETSGGLLVALGEAEVDAAIGAGAARGLDLHPIGAVTTGSGLRPRA